MSSDNTKKTDTEIIAFFNSERGKEILRKNEEKLKEEFKTKTGWFSPEEDKAWAHLNKEI